MELSERRAQIFCHLHFENDTKATVMGEKIKKPEAASHFQAPTGF
jgi:hypothetical protein